MTINEYSRVFDRENQSWTSNKDLNVLFLKAQEDYANHLLHARGHVFLNEIYDMLGFKRTPAGQVVGWVQNGFDLDFVIDFGLNEQDASNEDRIYLVFNVAGVMYDKI